MGYRLFLEKTQAYKKELGLVEHEPMYRHTTFQIGGPAEVFVQPRNLGVLEMIKATAKSNPLGFPVLVPILNQFWYKLQML